MFAGGHVDARAQDVRAVRKLALLHALEEIHASSTLRSRNGESVPASVSVPRLARISSALWLST
jgi:hypothetical protein